MLDDELNDSPTWDEFEQAIVNLDLKFMKLQKQIAAVKVSGEKIIRSEELKNKTTKAPENDLNVTLIMDNIRALEQERMLLQKERQEIISLLSEIKEERLNIAKDKTNLNVSMIMENIRVLEQERTQFLKERQEERLKMANDKKDLDITLLEIRKERLQMKKEFAEFQKNATIVDAENGVNSKIKKEMQQKFCTILGIMELSGGTVSSLNMSMVDEMYKNECLMKAHQI